MKFAGITSRALAILCPLLVTSACTTQNALNDGMQPQTSFAASAPRIETTQSEQETAELVASAPASEDAPLAAQQADTATIAPAYAKADGANSEPGQKLVQVAAVYPAAPSLAAVSRETGQQGEEFVEEPQTGPSKVRAYRASSREQECLARAMYFESNRSSREGMIAVGSVVMNRVDSGNWGNSVCGVVGAHRQFAPGVLSRNMDSRGSDLAMESAAAVLKGERHPRIYGDVMHFHTAGHRFKYNNMHYVAVAGGNSFYEKRRRMRGMRNTPQHVVMAQAGGSRIDNFTQPVKTAFAAPVRAARSLFGSDQEEPVKPKRVRQPKPQPVEAAAPALPAEMDVRPVKVVEAQAAAQPAASDGYLKAPSGAMVSVPASKGGRVRRAPASTTARD